ncbi:hypothetical protein T265_02787 [Opisthorchis viverrini]|uniref:Transporter, major facilitator family protein n=1 Tax=Opisthorchis viverrini TaxID=6198 RepID=A0A074ZUP4_OPIVI|nr:hypothetical protein T265_02787 [Opisthorchis viverrini]KER30856.1 hypothetical protein T265_02787 [Opisthorchis viverrini]
MWIKLRKPNVRRSPFFVIVCFFLYKTTETLLQAATRIHIYSTACSALVNASIDGNLCQDNKHKDYQFTKENDSDFLVEVNVNQTNEPAVLHFLSKEIEIQRLAGLLLIFYRVLFNLPATITCLLYGSLSNKIGRKWAMLIPSFGAMMACGWFACSLVPHLMPIPEAISFLLVGALSYGICGKSNAMSMGANSYITDLSNTKERTKLLGQLLGVNCFGLCIGSGLLALFYRYQGYAEILMFAASINGLLTLLFIFVVQESREITTRPILQAKRSKPNTMENGLGTRSRDIANPESDDLDRHTGNYCMKIIHVLKHSYVFLFKKRENDMRAVLLILFGSVLFNQMTKSGEQDAILLFVTNKPFRWGPETYGYYLTVYYGCMATLLTFILPIIEAKICPRDTTLIVIGMTMKIARLLSMGLSESTVLIFVAAVAGSAAGFISSGARSLISKLVNDDDVGASFAIVSCMETVANLFGGSLFTAIYNLTITVFPGAVFIIDAILHSGMLGGFIWLRYKIAEFEAKSGSTEVVR